MRALKILLLFLLSCHWSWGQHLHQAGAKSRSLGHATIALADHWSGFNSVGGTGRIRDLAVMAGVDQLYGIEGLNFYYAGANISLGSWGSGIMVQSFGDRFFSNSKLGITLGNQLGIASLGARINYHQIRAEGYATQSAFTLDVGGIVELGPQFFVGAELSNLTQSTLSSPSGDELPIIARTGIRYLPVTTVALLFEVEKTLDTPALLKAGIQYEPIDGLSLRGGFNTNPDNLFAGIGFKARKFRVDYALSHHTALGIIHSIGLSFLPAD